ncbi:MAG: RNA 2',3'-cyclic phosphodiesterase [Fimbriimonadaceae bacterium]|nr:RNA 2',3'-cyclic phosphodiesterase [Fimbriimonadaceae bacterium]
MAEARRRLFFAVRPPEPVLAHLANLIARHRASSPGPAWVRTENLHLTVLFVGIVPERLTGPLAKIGARVAASTPAFAATLGAPSGFPNPARPRVASVELLEPTGALSALHVALCSAARRFVLLDSRPLKAHVTIARAKAGGEPALRRVLAAVANEPAPPLPFPVSRLELLESRPRSSGPIYDTVAAFPLGVG